MTNANLLQRYRNLERAMQTTEDGDDYVRCMSKLDELGKEIQQRGLPLPEISASEYEARA